MRSPIIIRAIRQGDQKLNTLRQAEDTEHVGRRAFVRVARFRVGGHDEAARKAERKLAIVRALAEAKADVNATTAGHSHSIARFAIESTPLMDAVAGEDVNVVRLLLELGADPGIETQHAGSGSASVLQINVGNANPRMKECLTLARTFYSVTLLRLP